MERIENLLRFVLASGIGPVTTQRLIDHFGGADQVLGASEADLLAVESVGSKHVSAVREAADLDPRPELEAAAARSVDLIARDDPRYPECLTQTYAPPLVLYVLGELRPGDAVAVAVVGTRRASLYGGEQSERFGGLLGRAGFTVVSGLARGVDSYAHRGALAAGGRTVAVLGSGLGHVYPEENRDLAVEISERGAVVSEYPMATLPVRENFPRRNRVVAGLSLGVLVVEAPLRSGALITAQYAVEMNRELFVIPGRIDHRNTAGCHSLIRDGATLVRDLDDILAELGPQVQGRLAAKAEGARAAGQTQSVAAAMDETQTLVLTALGEAPTHIDHICASTGLPVEKVAAALMILELKRSVVQTPGKFFARADHGKS